MMQSVNQTQFATEIGRSKAYVSKLKQQGRLVFDETGKVKVQESKALISQTGSPEKQAVVDRNAQEREANQQEPQMDDMAVKAGSAYHQARAMKEKYAAMQAKISYEKEIGELLRIDDVRSAVMDSDTIVRNRLETLPDKLAPLLATETDEQKIRAMLIDHIEYMLIDLSQSIKKLEFV